MKILLSPAKKMKRDEDLAPWSKPRFLKGAEEVKAALLAMTPKDRKALWNCSDRLALENEERLSHMDLSNGTSCALFSYIGLAYQHLSPEALTDEALLYLQASLCILSALYGVLRPMDGITPYRLEMEAPLSVGGKESLYSFWGDRLAKAIEADDDTVINLASKEYADAVVPHLSHARNIDIVFLQEHKGKLVTKATLAKMARGEMTQWLAMNKIQDPEGIKDFDVGYAFSPDHSDEHQFVFLQSQ